jgi:hypothetical protein
MMIIRLAGGFNFGIDQKKFDLRACSAIVFIEMGNSRGRGLAESTIYSMCGDAVEMNSP